MRNCPHECEQCKDYRERLLADGFCPHDETKLVYKMHDVDGTNLVEALTCPECGYGTPSLT